MKQRPKMLSAAGLLILAAMLIVAVRPALAASAAMAEPTTGCKSKEGETKALMLLNNGDEESAGLVLKRNECHLFRLREVLDIVAEGTLTTSPPIPGECLRPRGEHDCYWTLAVKTAPIRQILDGPPNQTIKAPTQVEEQQPSAPTQASAPTAPTKKPLKSRGKPTINLDDSDQVKGLW